MRRSFLIAVGLVLAAGAPAAASPGDELVLRFAPGVSPAEQADLLATAGVARQESLEIPGGAVVSVEPGVTRRAALDALRDAPDVQWAEPNVLYRALAVPNDPLFIRQWGLSNVGQDIEGLPGVPGADVGAPAAWDRTTGDPNVNVAIADSGVAVGHPDLAPNISRTVPGRDEVDGDADPNDLEGHGTLVAGIIGARGNDGIGSTGVAWRAGLVPVRVLNADGAGTAADIADGFRYASQRGVRLVNASLGGPTLANVVSDAITASPNTLFVVASGNDGVNVDAPGQAIYPCAYPQDNVICVAASDPSDRLADLSNYGPRSVDLAAPGESITGPSPAYAPPAFVEGFDTPLDGRWIPDGTSDWATSLLAGRGVASDSPGGGYGAFRNDTITTAGTFSLAGGSGCRLWMRVRFDIGPGDGLRLEISSGGPWQAFSPLTGSSSGRFETVGAPLTAFQGAASLRLRLRFTSDGAGSGEGADIDEIRVACLGGGFDGDEFVTESGTSFAAPYVTGAAALVMSRYPTLSVAQVKQAILQGVTPVPSLAGRVVSGGRLSIPGALDAGARIAGVPPAATPLAAATVAAPRFGLRPPSSRRGIWSVIVTLSRPALTQVVFERRRPGTGIRGIRARWAPVRANGPRDRAATFRYRLGRLGKGTYRVTVRFPEDRRVLRRTFSVPGRR